MTHDEYLQLRETIRHGSDLFPFVKYHTAFPEDYTSFPLHWHDEMEIIYIQKGRLEINLDLELHIAEAGDIVLIRPGILHGFRQYHEDQVESTSILFQLELLYAPSADVKTSGFFTEYREDMLHCQTILSPGDRHYREPFLHLQNIFDLDAQKSAFYELSIQAELLHFFQRLFCFFGDRHPTTAGRSEKSAADIKTVIEYIHQHFKDTISIRQLADQVALSEPYFMRFFKSCTGMTCIDYINDYRLNIAARLLSETDHPIREVAADCGIDNVSYFNRLFRKKYDLTPVQFRRQTRRA